MNAVFGIILIAATAVLAFVAPERILPVAMEGVGDSVTFSLKLFGIYAVWLSVLKILEKGGLDKKIGKLLNPVTSRLFRDESEAALNFVNLNLGANLLGMGGAATPMGIRAVETMRHKRNSILLVVINSTSIQLIPTTILSLRAGLGATTDIMAASLIVNALTTACGILLVKLLVR